MGSLSYLLFTEVIPKNGKSDKPAVITGGITPSDVNHQLNKG
jgi:hypothetical protein